MEADRGMQTGRRTLLKGSAALSSLWFLPSFGGSIEEGAERRDERRLRSTAGVEAMRCGNVAVVALNRPSRGNLLDAADFADLLSTFQAIDDVAAIQATVLFGRGEHFSKGIVALTSRFERLFSDHVGPGGSGRLSVKPLVAMVHGQTTGLGIALPLCADVRIANADAVLSWPDPKHADLFLRRLAQEIRVANAKRFLLTGDDLDAHEAWRLGLVQHVAADTGEALDKAMAIARAIACRRIEGSSLA